VGCFHRWHYERGAVRGASSGAGRPSPLPINFGGFLICAALIAYALYAQLQLGTEPCPLCIFQRIGIAALGLVFLIAALHNPRQSGARIYAPLIALAALAAITFAARQLYIQHLPPGAIPSCCAPLSAMLKFIPLTVLIRKVLSGSGECGVVNWTFRGLAMPAWVLVWAAGLGLAGFIVNASRA
jgi:disulfide bond formation protein DsbB